MGSSNSAMTIEDFRSAVKEDLKSERNANHAIWYLNIKKFRFVNESYGYECGNGILEKFESYLSSRLVQRGFCTRLADDRFAVFVSEDGYESENATSAFESLYREFNLSLSDFGIGHPLDIAAGVYFLTPEDVEKCDIDYIIDQANSAHRRARAQGGNHVIFYDYEYAEKQRRANIIESTLSEAIASGEIEVWMQPLLDFVKGEVVASEALARWNHATLGQISPAEFIPVLEKAGKIGLLDRHIWRVACYAAHNRFLEKGERPVPFSVNVSRAEILDPTLPGYIEGILDEYDLPRDTIRLEMTENAYTEQPEELIAVVEDLRNRGFIVEMDDFGSGYSSLNMLRNLPVDVLKLDMGFLRKGSSDPSDAVILNSVIRMAHGLDIPVIAEGVETIEQAEMLKSMGCRFMQGYFFAKPMPIEQFYKLLDDTRSSQHTYAHGDKGNRVATLLDSQSDTAFFFNECVGPAFIYSAGTDHYEVMLTNDEFYTEIGVDQREYDLFKRNLLSFLDERNGGVFRRTSRLASQRGMARCTVKLFNLGKWMDCTIRTISSDEFGGVFVCYVRDVTEDTELALARDREDDEYALRDELTGMLTYHALDELIGGKLGKDGGTLLLADIDDFDAFAAVHDQARIDSIVDHVASILRAQLPSDALLARCGEGLFAAFLPSSHDKTDVRANACKVIDGLRCSRDYRDERVTCSIGLAYTMAGTSLRLGIVYRRALRALTIAKINGGDGFLLYETVRDEVENGIEVFAVQLRHAVDGELLPEKALEGEDLFNVISRDFEEKYEWNMANSARRNVRDAVFGALRYRSMAELPGVLSFDYDTTGDVIFLESVDEGGGIHHLTIDKFQERLFDFGSNMATESMARLSVLLSNLKYLPVSGNVDLKCRLREDKDFRWYRFSFTSLRDENSYVIRGLGYGEDIDLSRNSTFWWKDRAMHDGLTGLLNREGMEDAVEMMIAKNPEGMMFIVDVDNFKSINDQLGHLSGDSVLCELADTMLALFRDVDAVGRYGSDEMIAFISGLASRELAHKRADAIVEMANQIHVGDYGNISVSVGAALLDEGKSFYDFLELADHAVHVSKANGKNCYTIADETEQRIDIHDQRASAHGRISTAGEDLMEIEAKFNRERKEAKGN